MNKQEQVVSLQCAHCQVTIETLNDKVMSLMAQPKRQWVGLTDEEVEKIYRAVDGNEFPLDFYAEIEAKLKEKNT